MSRRSFRSQPSLQRSGGWRPSSALLSLAGLAVMGLSFGAMVSHLQQDTALGGQTYGGSALEETAPAPAAPPAPADAALQAAAPVLAVPPPQLVAASAPVAAKTATKARAARAKPARAQPAAEPTPQQSWEQQRQDYERAVEAYDASERKEGYRWAQANRIRLNRYCRAAERRTPAFLQGCLSYVRSEGGGGAERAGTGAGAERAGEPG